MRPDLLGVVLFGLGHGFASIGQRKQKKKERKKRKERKSTPWACQPWAENPPHHSWQMSLLRTL
jgi:hypothetical protein